MLQIIISFPPQHDQKKTTPNKKHSHINPCRTPLRNFDAPHLHEFLRISSDAS